MMDNGEEDKKIKLLPGQTFRRALISNGVSIRVEPRHASRNQSIDARRGRKTFTTQVQMKACTEDMQCLLGCGMLVRKGMALLEEQDVQEKQMLKKEPYWRLTCRACVRRDLEEDAEMVVRLRPDTENILRPKDPFAWRT